MLGELQIHKYRRRFALLDADGNGFIEERDYELVAERLADSFGVPHGSQQYAQLLATQLGLWQELVRFADRDGDGRVSIDEFVAAYAEMLARPDAYDRLVRVPARAIIALADRDGDGKLSLREYADAMRGYAVPEADSRAAFGHLDRDGDGFIDLDEMEKNVEEFYIGRDDHAPGNWLFGPYAREAR